MPRIISKNWLYLLLTFFIAFSITLVSARIAHVILAERSKESTEGSSTESETLDPDSEPPSNNPTKISFINLQPIVDEWVKSLPARSGAQVGVMVYDLDQSRVAAEYNAKAVFYAASLYKLFFVYDGYEQIENGSEKPDEFFTFDYDKGNLSFGTCLDLMIRESYNPCADPMRADPVKFARIEAFIKQLGLSNTSEAGLETSAADMIELLKIYYRHDGLSEASWQKILDSMLNQPVTTYDWRQGLPSGFHTAKVYNKVGWNSDNDQWKNFNDAAIVEFPEQNRHYAIVVLSENLDPKYLSSLGQMLETAILNAK